MASLSEWKVKGVGPSVARKLAGAGIDTVEALADLDQRRIGIDGLSPEHVAVLRENARRSLAAAKTRDLALVESLGPSAIRKLERAGIKTIDDLMGLDLRREAVDGLSTDHLQRAKWNARYYV